MQKTIYLFLVVILFFTIQGKAQTDFRPGYYITNENDTIFGLIDYRGEIRNSKVCVYKKDAGSESSVFQPFEIDSYRFLGSKFYVSKMVPDGEDKNPIFLEYLVNGIANLYFFRDTYGPHYLIEKEGEVFAELTNDEKIVYIDNIQYLKSSNKHIGLLRATFSDCNDIYPEISHVKLEHESLIELTKNYHEFVCEDGAECIVYEKKIPAVRVKVAPVIGLNISNIKFRNSNTVYSDMDFDMSLNWAVGLNINVTLPRSNEKISFIYGALIENNHYYSNNVSTTNAADYYNEVNTHFFSFKNAFSLNYTYPKGKIRPIANIGGLLYLIFDQETERISEVAGRSVVDTYIYNDINYNAINGGFTIGAGLNYYLQNSKTLFFLLAYDFITGFKLEDAEEQQKEAYNITTISLKAGVYF